MIESEAGDLVLPASELLAVRAMMAEHKLRLDAARQAATTNGGKILRMLDAGRPLQSLPQNLIPELPKELTEKSHCILSFINPTADSRSSGMGAPSSASQAVSQSSVAPGVEFYNVTSVAVDYNSFG